MCLKAILLVLVSLLLASTQETSAEVPVANPIKSPVPAPPVYKPVPSSPPTPSSKALPPAPVKKPTPPPPAKVTPSPPVYKPTPPPPAKVTPPPPVYKPTPPPPAKFTPPPPVYKPTPPPPASVTPPPPVDCIPLCLVRCKLHSRKNVCLRACVTCCDRCKCVPPGQYGQREKCGKCYTNMTTRGGRPKCP